MRVVATSTVNVLLLAAPVLTALAALLLIGAAHRRDTHQAAGTLSRETIRQDRPNRLPPASPTPSGREVERAAELTWHAPSELLVALAPTRPVTWTPPDTETLGVTRRQFLNHSLLSTIALTLTAFGSATLAFLWPTRSAGFGATIAVGNLQNIKNKIAVGNGFAYYPQGRMWITAYPAEALQTARRVYDPAVITGMEHGIVALYQKCPHLGCRVPQCVSSQWFECPCHGSQYNQVGEKKGGPAPRGMDRFPLTSPTRPSPSTPASSSKAPRSAPTPPARTPKDHTASTPPPARCTETSSKLDPSATRRPRLRRPGCVSG